MLAQQLVGAFSGRGNGLLIDGFATHLVGIQSYVDNPVPPRLCVVEHHFLRHEVVGRGRRELVVGRISALGKVKVLACLSLIALEQPPVRQREEAIGYVFGHASLPVVFQQPVVKGYSAVHFARVQQYVGMVSHDGLPDKQRVGRPLHAVLYAPEDGLGG